MNCGILNFKNAIARALCALILASPTAASAQSDPGSWRVLIEPKFMRPEVSQPIPGSKKTVFAAGYLKENEPVYFSKAEFDALGMDWETFAAKARENSKDNKLKAEFIRSKKKVIQYAVLSSENPLTATAVLSPDFWKKFREIFGDTMIVALPDRFTIYLFPKLAGDFQDHAPMILDDYKAALFPVSTEAFELTSSGLRAIGNYEP
jgi:hypothetical protein